jgi:hypothetical protein
MFGYVTLLVVAVCDTVLLQQLQVRAQQVMQVLMPMMTNRACASDDSKYLTKSVNSIPLRPTNAAA